MGEIYITGHRNPDMDSICAAYAYAVLKNTISGEKSHYTAVRCGHLRQSQKQHFAETGITPPPYMRDVHPKVSDVMLTAEQHMQASQPIYDLIKAYNASRPSAFPIFEGNEFLGLLSVDDITAWFLSDNADDNPKYTLTENNICSVLQAKKIQGTGKTIHAPVLVGAAALDDFRKFVDSSENSIVVMGYRKEHIEYAIKTKAAAIIITTTTNVEGIDFSAYKGLVAATELSTAEAIRKLRMCPELRTIMAKQGPRLHVTDSFDDGKELLMSSHLRGLPVFDGEEFAGFVTRRCFLEKPKYNVILVDHNERNQSIRGIENANVCEIIDHHRLDAIKTEAPIYIDAEPLGSTCTIVYQQFIRNGVVPNHETAIMLLTGIIADTVILKSPTTTQVDREAANDLGELCGLNIQEFGEKMFSKIESLCTIEPREAILSDFKAYKERGISFGIGQCETTTLKDLSGYKDTYLEELEKIRQEQHLDWSMLMVTDVLREQSILLTTDTRFLRKLPYQALKPLTYDMTGVLSRKKQLLPAAIHAIELSM